MPKRGGLEYTPAQPEETPEETGAAYRKYFTDERSFYDLASRPLAERLSANFTHAGSRPGLEHRRCDYYPSEPSPRSHCYKYPRRCRELTSQLSEPVRILPTRITGAGANPSATAS